MVVENLQTSTVAQWLLGSDWYDAWLWHPLVLAVLLSLLLLAIVSVVRKCREGDDSVTPETASSFGTLAGACLLCLAVPLIAIMTRLTTPDTKVQASIDRVFVPLGQLLEHVLGKDWIDGALYTWLFLIWGFFTAVFAVAWIFCAIARGPGRATEDCGRGLLDMSRDIARISPRRVLALGWLAWRESIRRRVWVIFGVFIVLIMFAGWFLQSDSDHPAQLYIQFVLNWTMYLTMIYALLLSALSLPGDIRDRTLQTIVTKPVRKSELLLGRLLGFTAMGTVLLAGIGLISYAFTVIGLNHTHQLSAGALVAEPLPGQKLPMLRGQTSPSHGHRHEVTIAPNGEWTVEKKFDHTHELIIEEKNGVTVYRLGPPLGFFTTRVPIYASSLRFWEQKAKAKRGKGVNVGDEWMYRSFIAGQTNAAGIWTFQIDPADFPADKFPSGIPIEMTIEPFRTHKGDMEHGVMGQLWVRNPDNGLTVTICDFQAKKFATDTQYIPFAKQVRADAIKIVPETDSEGKPIQLNDPPVEIAAAVKSAGKGSMNIDFFNDIVTKDGRFEVGLQCLEHAQYFGMSRADMYIRAADTSFAANMVKGYFGIWLQMVLVLSIGLLFSTFLGGPVALLGTLAAIMGGWFRAFILGIAVATVVGGGPIESAYRMESQENQINPLPPGITMRAAVELDKVARIVLRGVQAIVPPLADIDFIKNVAFGFDIDRTMLTKCVLSEIGYLLPLLVLAYFCLRAREIAQ